MKKLAIALTAALTVAAPALAADYVPFIKANQIVAPTPDSPTLKEKGITHGVFYKVETTSGNQTKARVYTGDHETGNANDYWAVECQRDPMTDQTLCTMSRGDFGLVYDGNALAGSLVALTVQADGTGIETRVGNRQFMRSTPKDGQTLPDAQAAAVIKGLLAKETVLIRYTHRASRIVTLRKITPAGFEQAANYMMWRYHHMS